MRLTTRTSLALRTLMFCAAHPDRLARKAEVSVVCGASENHLAQVIHQLGRLGYLQTHRGRSGGIALGRPAAEITVGQVCRELEAVVPFVDCMDRHAEGCPLQSACTLKCMFEEALTAFYAALDRYTVADLVKDNAPLQELLRAA